MNLPCLLGKGNNYYTIRTIFSEKYRQELTEASRLRKEIIKEAQQKAQEIIHSTGTSTV